jgi:multidrug efflux system outer membrane protein
MRARLPASSLTHPRVAAASLLGVALLVLAGCAHLSARQPASDDTPVPAQWSLGPASSAAPTAESLADWWQRFNDAQLTALVAHALAANTDIRGARAALAQARALRDVRAANLGPTVGGSATAQRSKSGDALAANSYQAGFDASWEPDVFGANRSALEATQADAQAAASSLAAIQVSLAADVAVTYIQLRGLQARLGIARSNLAAQAETLQITRWRAQAGLASSLDVELGIADSEQTSAQIPTLETGVAQSVSSLAVLTGQAPGMLRAALAAPAPVPQAVDTLALAQGLGRNRQRPDVRAAEQRVRAALARVAQADAARYPGFQISGSLGLRALSLAALGSGGSAFHSLLAGVSVPLFDGGALRAQLRAQEAALEQARSGYQAAVLAAFKDVEDALVSLQGDTERLAHLQAAAQAAANAGLLARQRYASGLIDFRAVLDTQRTLLSTQDGVESTRASLSADLVRLYKAFGGGWSPGLETVAGDTSAWSDKP